MTQHTPLPRELARNLRSATDEQVSQVVAMIDSMAERGTADSLIDVVRPRLATLRPVRPISLSRTLFSPLDPVIVAPLDWRPGSLTIPRSVLGTIWRAVVAKLGEQAAELEKLRRQRHLSAEHLRQEIGSRLWPAASDILCTLERTNAWTEETRLPEPVWLELRDILVLVFAVATTLDLLVTRSAATREIRAFLSENRHRASFAFPLLAKLLIARHQRPEIVIAAIAEFGDRQSIDVIDRALAKLLSETTATTRTIISADPARSAFIAHQVASWVKAIDRPKARQGLSQLRASAAQACERRLERCLTDDVMGPLTDPSAGPEQAILEAETGARNASRLRSAARALGAGHASEKILMQVASRISALPTQSLDRVDRLRLLEILLGPENTIAIERAQTASAGGSNDGAGGRSGR